MRIFLFTSVLAGGGAERVLCQLANSFSTAHEVILIAAYKKEGEYFVSDTVRKIYIDKDVENKNPIRQIKGLRKLIKDNKPDICVSFLPQPNFKMLLAAFGLETKVVVSVRNDPNREYASLLTRLLAKILYPLANGIVFQTHDAQKWFPRGIQKKSEIIMNQVDPRFFDAERISEDYWVATGRLNAQKNYSLMIKAFKRVVDIYPEEKLRIYGKGELKSSLQVLINELGLQDNVYLMGQSNDVVEVLAHAKAFLLSSDYEGMPNGLLEALAMGLTCISTDCPCGGPRDMIETYDNGILVPVNDENALSDALLLLIENPTMKCKFSRRSKEKSKEFHPVEIANKWEQYLKKQ